MHPGDGGTILPDTELYIIVNGKPTTSKVVWCSLVNVDHVKVAIREINWLYSFKKKSWRLPTILRTMLEKADEHNISGFHDHRC